MNGLLFWQVSYSSIILCRCIFFLPISKTDVGAHTIRFIDISARALTTLAGKSGSSGFTNGRGTQAAFNRPQGITLDATGTFAIIVSAIVQSCCLLRCNQARASLIRSTRATVLTTCCERSTSPCLRTRSRHRCHRLRFPKRNRRRALVRNHRLLLRVLPLA